ncbi:AsnC family transcriptional regulator [Salinirubrum litoreum]|uniref:AsnC family transcriptional regulator n=1 Tax=Salinirubrum litoreum TaxID=1126234 RepID=A0ABD5R9U6_9EURY|nr:AsnC family transcriptional regulator [Salinirubrum litoreum]
MRTLDETDLKILRLLSEDGRKPYSEIGDSVGLSGPAVSDRVSRLRELGVIRGFTVDVDRSTLRDGTPMLLRLSVVPDDVESVVATLGESEETETVYTTAAGDVVAHVNLPTTDARSWLLDTVSGDAVRSFDADLLTDVETTDAVAGTDFALSCAECGNTVTEEGVTTRVGDDLVSFCCSSCESRYQERYEELKQGV